MSKHFSLGDWQKRVSLCDLQSWRRKSLNFGRHWRRDELVASSRQANRDFAEGRFVARVSPWNRGNSARAFHRRKKFLPSRL